MAHFRICSIPGCGKPLRAYGYCGAHGMRWKRHGDPLGGATFRGNMAGSPLRFFREVVLPHDSDECLTWPFTRYVEGHAQMKYGDRLERVSRVVCEHFNGPPPTPKHEAAHSCGKGHEGCVAKRHIRWATHAENEADKLIHGTTNRGARNGQATLTETDVREILALKGSMSQTEIAARFSVNPGTISKIHCRTRWGWL